VTRRQGPPDAAERAGWLGVDALATCDLVVTPGLSVDRHGTRLGQGGGCYDRALRHRDPAAPVVTLLHEGEASDVDLPVDEHDLPVDAYVTTTGRLVRLR
jgi:5-formyltetrahydrofolate cyclo-ligase